MSFADGGRDALREIAKTTIAAIKAKAFRLNGVVHVLHIKSSEKGTRYYSPDSSLSQWPSNPPHMYNAAPKQQQPTTTSAAHIAPLTYHPHPRAIPVAVYISILEISTLDGARLLLQTNLTNGRTAILNFASATKPGGGFLNGAQAQEESIARSSTLYPTLLTSTAQKFYDLHNLDANNGFYSHSMIYSPGVVVFRSDDGGWTQPIEVDVLTSAAVNAGEVRKSMRARLSRKVIDDDIERQMRERMARILYLFQKEGVKNIVLGSFGTGVFNNDVDVVARLWADLLSVPEARFRSSFDRVVFAIIGRKTFVEFENAFNTRTKDLEVRSQIKMRPGGIGH